MRCLSVIQIMPIVSRKHFQQMFLFLRKHLPKRLHISSNIFEIIDKGTILDNAMSFSRKGFQNETYFSFKMML